MSGTGLVDVHTELIKVSGTCIEKGPNHIGMFGRPHRTEVFGMPHHTGVFGRVFESVQNKLREITPIYKIPLPKCWIAICRGGTADLTRVAGTGITLGGTADHTRVAGTGIKVVPQLFRSVPYE